MLGTTADGPLDLDLDRLIGTHACIVANSGGGKSGLIRRLLETTHGRVQHIVLDIEDEFYTLRERLDYVIAGGDGGDAPATLNNAEGLALAALTHGFSLIVQMNDLGADAPAFVGRFLTAMIGAPRDLWHPALVVIDEAQRFAPQDGSTAATRGVKALTGQGRKRGFTAVLASQRIAKIDADVRGDVNNWMLGRVGQSLDRRTVADALGFSATSAEARGLQGLQDRHFWGFGPAIAREPVLFRVADVETTPVRPGQAKVATPPPPEALRAILSGLATPLNDLPATDISAESLKSARGREAAASINAIAKLQTEASDLRGQLDAMRAAWNFRGELLTQSRAAVSEAMHLLDDVSVTLASISTEDKIPAQGGGGPTVDEGQTEGVAATTMPPRATARAPAAETAIAKPSGGGNAPSGADLTRGARAMIDALARFHPRAMTIENVAKAAGVSVTSSAWRLNKRSFVESPLVERLGDGWRVSAQGIALLGLRDAPNDPAALRAFWLASFPPSTAAMLNVLIAEPRASVEKDVIADRAGVSPTSSGLGSGLRELVAHGLIVKRGNFYSLGEALQ